MEWEDFWEEFDELPRVEQDALRVYLLTLARERSAYELFLELNYLLENTCPGAIVKATWLMLN